MKYLYELITTPNNLYSSLQASEKLAFLEKEIREEIREKHRRKECIKRNKETAEFEAKVKANPTEFAAPALNALFKGV